MAACKFSIAFSGSPGGVYNKAKTAAEKQGGNFSGDESSGVFDVSFFGSAVKGSYSVAGQQLDIVIDSKPFLISCSTIEGFLKGQIS